MAKKFAKINGLFNVFVLNTKNNTQYYDPSKIIDNVVDIDKNTICFVNAADVDIDKKIGKYTIKENDRFVITQGGIYAYTGNQNSSQVIPDTPGTSTEDTWRPIYINNTFINDLEFTKSDEYGDIITINPKKPSLDFTTKQTKLTVDGKENAYDILKIDNSYNDIYDKVSLDFGINSNHLKKFIEDVLPKYENPGNGNLSFVLDETVPETGETSTNTIGSFSANQKENTSIKFLAGDNITLEGTTGQLTITGPYVPSEYNTLQIKIAEDIEIGGTKLGDIIAGEDIFKTEDNRDVIPKGMTLHEVLVKILSGLTPEEWGTQTVNPQIVLGKNTAIVLTAKDYYTNEEIDLNKTLIELVEGTTLLITYTTTDPNVYQNITVSPFIGGYALDNPDKQDDSEAPEYIEYECDTEYQRTFDEAKSSFGSYITDYSGFTKENIKVEQNQIVLTVNKGLNDFSVKQDWSIQPDTYFTQYNVYPMSNRGTVGIDRPIIINSERFKDVITRGVLSKLLQINGITKEFLPYYTGFVSNFDKKVDFVENNDYTQLFVDNTDSDITITKYDTDLVSPLYFNQYASDYQFIFAVPANDFLTSDWLENIIDNTSFKQSWLNWGEGLDYSDIKTTIKINNKTYYVLTLLCNYEDTAFGAVGGWTITLKNLK